ncbi:protein of unknown function (plasmid) [Azospirillum baldaniorum]|uniref:Uncharacterized protein n=1 Tax=Azospirillum baldaniorum TaxID=1064539 RepID=A0A9P1NQD3_9PROT|nr:protein of unknown function [Azospirillum baldaniorum]
MLCPCSRCLAQAVRLANLAQEVLDLLFQGFGLPDQLVRRQGDDVGGLQRSLCARGDVGDVPVDVRGSGRGLLDVAADLRNGGVLLMDGRGDGRGGLVDLLDGADDVLDGRYGLFGRVLHHRNLLGDLVGGTGGLAGQVLHLVRHHGEALAGLAGAGRFDRGVQREQVRLAGDLTDDVHHLADPPGGVRQPLDDLIGAAGPVRRQTGDIGRPLDLLADFLAGRVQLFGGRGDGLHVGRGLLRGAGNGRALGAGLLRLGGHGAGRRVQAFDLPADGGDHALDPLLHGVGHREHRALPLDDDLLLMLLLLGPQPLHPKKVLAEALQGARHVAKLVPTAESGDGRHLAAFRKVEHDPAERVERAEGDPHRNEHGDRDDGRHQQGGQRHPPDQRVNGRIELALFHADEQDADDAAGIVADRIVGRHVVPAENRVLATIRPTVREHRLVGRSRRQSRAGRTLAVRHDGRRHPDIPMKDRRDATDSAGKSVQQRVLPVELAGTDPEGPFLGSKRASMRQHQFPHRRDVFVQALVRLLGQVGVQIVAHQQNERPRHEQKTKDGGCRDPAGEAGFSNDVQHGLGPETRRRALCGANTGKEEIDLLAEDFCLPLEITDNGLKGMADLLDLMDA